METITEKAISLLRENGRASFSEIGRTLGVPRELVLNRISPLFRSGALRVITAVHPHIRGIHVLAHLSLKLRGSPSGLIDFLAEHEQVVFISQVTGPFQVIAEIHVDTLTELHSLTALVRSRPEVVDMQHALYERVLSSSILGEEPEQFGGQLDRYNLRLISLLQQDGRASYSRLASEVGLSVTATRERVLRLIEQKIIQVGLVRGRNFSGTDLVFGFGINAYDHHEAIQSSLLNVSGVEFLARSVGRFDYIATISFSALPAFNELLQQITDLPGIEHVEHWLHVNVHLERYLHGTGQRVDA